MLSAEMHGAHRVRNRRSFATRCVRLLPALLFLAGFAAPQPATADDEQLVVVYATEEEDGSYVFRVDNNHIIPVYVRVDAPNLINLAPDRPLPVTVGLDPGEKTVPIFTLRPTSRTGRRGYGLQYSFAQGNPETAHHDDSYLYLLPFAHGTKYRLSQGFHGRFTHNGENEYAVDFEIDIGTAVYAARGGMVAEVKEDSTVGGTAASYGDDANYVLILHDDGSFGNYAHLQTDGVIVEPGDRVAAGEPIAYSGNTGRSSGPHLHFDVRLPTFDGTMQSVPFLFRGENGAALEPQEGAFYYSYHPGGAPFVAEYGRDLTLESYASYRVPITGPEKVDVRIEQIDLTFLVFLRNGLARDTEADLRFQLVGLESDAGRTVHVTAPARTEVLATILRPVPGATSIQYGYTLSYMR